MKQIITGLLCCCVLLVQAQDSVKTKSRIFFFSANQAMHIEGSAGGAFGAQSVNGVQFGKWSAGVGIGMDKYVMRSAPLFVHLRRQLPFARVPLYLYADGGLNVLWLDKSALNFSTNVDRKNGTYWDAGMQYHFVVRGRSALLFSLGYSEKTFSEEIDNLPWCNFGPCPPQKNIWDYRLRRILFKAGFQF
jgi:hypothetical protein